MSVWNNDHNEYIMNYWCDSPIEWQQKNRNILNNTIKIYNQYIRNMSSLKDIQNEIYYAEDKLRNECGDYMDDINQMKINVDKIEKERQSDILQDINTIINY